MAPLMLWLAIGFIGGFVITWRALARRRRRSVERLERRRLEGLGSVEAHRERYR
jgi:hypothetical protein